MLPHHSCEARSRWKPERPKRMRGDLEESGDITAEHAHEYEYAGTRGVVAEVTSCVAFARSVLTA